MISLLSPFIAVALTICVLFAITDFVKWQITDSQQARDFFVIDLIFSTIAGVILAISHYA